MGALIVGQQGIEQMYRTGRGSVTMRAVVDIDEDAKGRTMISITELPYQVNPDNLALKIAELADAGKIRASPTSATTPPGRTGQRLVVVLKRDAVARVVLNNLFKHTELQTNFSANMLALVDGVPRTLTLDQFVSHWIDPPGRGHPAADPLPAPRGRGAGPRLPRPGQGARHARRGHRADPTQPRRRGGPRRA